MAFYVDVNADVTTGLNVTLKICYDPAKIPVGVNEADLVFYSQEGSGWVKLNTTINTLTHCATVTTSHFSTWSLAPDTALAVTEIKRMDANPIDPISTITSANYSVAFNQIASGVDVNDFELTTTGTISGASVTSVTPTADLSVFTVTVNIGSDIGTIRLDLKSSGTGIEDSDSNPISGGFTDGEEYTLAESGYKAPTVRANNGWTLESKENSNVANIKMNTGYLRVGDDAKNRQYRSLLYFNTADIPNNAVITKAVIKIKKEGFNVSGTDPLPVPFNAPLLGDLVADMKKGTFGAAPLELGDFSALAAPINTAGKFNQIGASDWYQLTLSPANFKYINLVGATQFRLRFTKDDNNDKGADYITIYAGEDNTNAPRFFVEYTTP